MVERERKPGDEGNRADFEGAAGCLWLGVSILTLALYNLLTAGLGQQVLARSLLLWIFTFLFLLLTSQTTGPPPSVLFHYRRN